MKVSRFSHLTERQEAILLALAHKKAQESRKLLEAAGCQCQAVLNWTLEHEVVCIKCKKQMKHYFLGKD